MIVEDGAGTDLSDMIEPSVRNGEQGVEWEEVASTTGSSYINLTRDLEFRFNDMETSFSTLRDGFDPYFDHNETIRRAIDSAPEWLNATLSWKFHEIWDMYGYQFADLLTNSTIDWRYKDEIAFCIAYLPEEVLNRYYVFPQILVDNVRMMYRVSEEVEYAEIFDVNRTDGQHSSVNYSMPGSNLTLSEEYYYRYLVVPRGSLEYPYYINTSSELQTEREFGEFWREYLYNQSDPGFIPLMEYIKNETYLWNMTRNSPPVNGAVGGVTRWMMDSMVFGMPDKRSNQPIIAYQQHVGMCGEHSYLLTAVGKIALIPTVTVINFEAMHAWNMFYERGWHVWRAYDGIIDDTYSEGAPGSVSIHTAFDPDTTVFSAAPVHTLTSNITINVKDESGKPVDGAMVKLDTQPSMNDPNIYGVIADHTDPEGNVTFEVGYGFNYHVQVIAPIGQFPGENDRLPVALPDPAPGVNYTFNVELNRTMPLKANLSMIDSERVFGTRFNVSASSLEQSTTSFRDPLGFGFTSRKDVEKTRIWVYFLDDENLSMFRSGQEFFPMGLVNLTRGQEGSVILPDGKNWTMIVIGMDQPYTTSFVRLNISAFRSTLYPEAFIIEPVERTFVLGESVHFKSELRPYAAYMGNLDHFWFLNGGSTPISMEEEFDLIPDLGIHTMLLSIWNSTGEISSNTLVFEVVLPQLPPVSNISSPEEGLVVEFGTDIDFSSQGTFDPNNDDLEYQWKDVTEGLIISYLAEFTMKLRAGYHTINLKVSDGTGFFSESWVNLTVLEPNTAPVPYISSPVLFGEYYVDEWIHLSANSSFDLEDDELSFLWSSSIDGMLSTQIEVDVKLSKGEHEIILGVSDGKLNSSSRTIIYVKERELPVNLPPEANISSPFNGENFFVSDVILFGSQGSFDPEGIPLRYSWSVDGINLSNRSTFQIRLSPGVHVIRLTVSDGIHSDEVSLTVLVTNRAPVIDLEVNGEEVIAESILEMIENETIHFDGSGSTDPDGGQLFFEWFVDGDPVSEKEGYTTSFSGGIYLVSLTVTDELNSSRSIDIYIRSDPATDVDDDDATSDDDALDREEIGIGPIAAFLLILIAILILLIVVFLILRRNIEEGDDFEILEE